jgi:hypothetical protein
MVSAQRNRAQGFRSQSKAFEDDAEDSHMAARAVLVLRSLDPRGMSVYKEVSPSGMTLQSLAAVRILQSLSIPRTCSLSIDCLALSPPLTSQMTCRLVLDPTRTVEAGPLATMVFAA